MKMVTILRTKVRTGSSLVEYSLILSMVTVGCVVALESMGHFMRSPLERLAHMDSDLRKSTSTNAAHIPTEIAMEAPPAELAPWRHIHTNLALLACAMLACAVVAYRRRIHKLELQLPVEPEPDDVRSTLVKLLAEKRQRILRILSSRTQAMFANRLEVRHVMTTDTVTVDPKTPVEDLRKLMAERRVRHLLVVDSRDGAFRGVISDRDLLRGQGPRAGDIMTSQPISVPADSPLAPALTQMLNHRFSCLPVVTNGKLEGVFTLTDAALTLQSVLQMLEQVGFLRPGDDGGHTPFEMECTLHMLQKIVAEAEEGVQPRSDRAAAT